MLRQITGNDVRPTEIYTKLVNGKFSKNEIRSNRILNFEPLKLNFYHKNRIWIILLFLIVFFFKSHVL